jgi:hypothetical protein
MGNDCSPAAALKTIGLRQTSLPFDWLQSSPAIIINAIKDDFRFFHKNLKLVKNGQRVMDPYGFQFPHDYPTIKTKEPEVTNADETILLDESKADYSEDKIVDNYIDYTEAVLEKYQRRIVRLRNILIDSKPLIILMRCHYNGAVMMKQFIDTKYRKNTVIVLATKECYNTLNSHIIICDPEKNSLWNDHTIWDTAIKRAISVIYNNQTCA